MSYGTEAYGTHPYGSIPYALTPPPTPVPTTRTLYLYENAGVQALAVSERALYEVENLGVQAITVLERALYEQEVLGIQALTVLERALYQQENQTDGTMFPWLEKITPTAQFPGGQVTLYGDGFGDWVEVAHTATMSASSGTPANAIDNTQAAWTPTDGTSSWIRVTFANPNQKVVAIALEQPANGTDFGAPLFRFSDLGADVTPGNDPARYVAMTNVPVGTGRTLYTLNTPRTCNWVEVHTPNAGGSNPSLAELWVWASDGEAARTGVVLLNAESCGVVTWASRSPLLWPSNLGSNETGAIVMTVPSDAVSGLVKIEETP